MSYVVAALPGGSGTAADYRLSDAQWYTPVMAAVSGGRCKRTVGSWAVIVTGFASSGRLEAATFSAGEGFIFLPEGWPCFAAWG